MTLWGNIPYIVWLYGIFMVLYDVALCGHGMFTLFSQILLLMSTVDTTVEIAVVTARGNIPNPK